ncbi:MAG: sigma-70 family RNA polymerase sigma factor [Clostridia bacterium]|nr:sigma-70 family RNA polymerase sigma factor [Clostridia bacterium]
MKKYEMNEKEKGVILGIILNTRNDYLKKEKYSKVKFVQLDNVENMEGEECVEDIVERILDNIATEKNFGQIFKNKNIKTIIEKALTNKQRSVLFCYYYQNKKDREVGEELDMKEDTVRKTRNRALEKIRKLINEEEKI